MVDSVVTMVRFRWGEGEVGGVSQQVQDFLGGAQPIFCAVFAGGMTPSSLGAEGQVPSSGSSTARWVIEPVLHPFNAGCSSFV
jgi:hypothetical protein